MRHFATESGKSKGQFYTPAEVSRVIAKVVGIGTATRQDETVYDPTCGSGSLLLKVAAEAPRGISIYGQENDNATWALAVMNMFLHGAEDADIRKGDTIVNPRFLKGNGLQTFDFAVANPPFSQKSWSNGLENDYDRFELGRPPDKNGDYAFLLHILKSLKSHGKAAVILPLGALIRPNAEALIRRRLIERGYIKGIIGLPGNLFYGTGIPASIVVLDKENAQARTGVFMIDASQGFTKDGAKNRLRSQDIHKIVDVFTKQTELAGYSRMVPVSEIGSPDNAYNLSISRYIDSSEPEDVQDLHGHLHGGIPDRDVEALGAYWAAFPSLRAQLFKSNRPGYNDLAIDVADVYATVTECAEVRDFSTAVLQKVDEWFGAHRPVLQAIDGATVPQQLIADLGDDLLARFKASSLLDEYDLYEQLMTYWHDVMHDDIFLIMSDGWMNAAEPRVAIDDKERKLTETPGLVIGGGRSAVKWKMDLIPPALIVSRYFSEEQQEAGRLSVLSTEASRALEEYIDEHGVEDGLLAEAMDDGKVNRKLAASRLRELSRDKTAEPEEVGALRRLLELFEAEATAKKAAKDTQASLDLATLKKYADLDLPAIKQLVCDDKWHGAVKARVNSTIETLIMALVSRAQQLGARYSETLEQLESDVARFDDRVAGHLADMGVK